MSSCNKSIKIFLQKQDFLFNDKKQTKKPSASHWDDNRDFFPPEFVLNKCDHSLTYLDKFWNINYIQLTLTCLWISSLSFFFISWKCFTHYCVLSLVSGVPCPAGRNAGNHQAAWGGPVSCPETQRPLWGWTQRLQANKWGTQKESCGIPAENPKGKRCRCGIDYETLALTTEYFSDFG